VKPAHHRTSKAVTRALAVAANSAVLSKMHRVRVPLASSRLGSQVVTFWSGLTKPRQNHRDFGQELPREEAKRSTGLGQAVAGLAMKEDTPLRRL
jgi:hypothetical protein